MINRVRASLEGLSTRQKVLASGLAATAIGGTAAAYEIGKFADHSVKAAASFQQANTLLTTQAGVAQSRIKGLGDQFLQLAPRFGTTAQALSEAMYHVASAGVPAREQLGALKAAAMGAAIGNANLEDTTNALVAVLRSGVGGVHGARDAMAKLLAIVGAGNMRLQDFVAAMGTGLPGAAKTFGVSLQSAGAALAYLTDTGMGAQMAATRLTMAMALLGGPTAHSSKILHALGLTSDQVKSKFAVVSQMLEKAGISTSKMAADLHKPDGLVVALTDLKTRMNEAGLSADTQAAVISRAFGGGHMGKAIMQLYESLPKVAQKFAQINASVGSFGQHWQETTQTAVFQAKNLHGAFNSIGVAIGEALLPAVQKLLGALVPVIAKVADFATHHKTLAAVILGAAFALSVLAAVAATVGLVMMAVAPAIAAVSLPVLGIVAAIALLGVGIFELVKHWHQVWDFIVREARAAWENLRGFLFTTWSRIVADADLIWEGFRGFLSTLWGDIRNDLFTAWGDVASFFSNLWSTILNGVKDGWSAIVNFFKDLGKTIADPFVDAGTWLYNAGRDVVSGLWNGMKDVWAAVSGWLVSVGGMVTSAVVNASEWLYQHGRDAFSGLWNGMKDVWNTVANWLASTGGRVTNAVVNASEWLYQHGRDAFTGLWNGIKDVWETVSGWLSSTGGRVQNAITGASSWLYSRGQDAITGLWDGIKDVWKDVSTWLGRVDTMVKQYFKDAGKWLFEAGKDVVQGFWDGLKSHFKGVESWVSSKFHGLVHGVKGIFGIHSPSQVFHEIGAALVDGLIEGMDERLPSLIAEAAKISSITAGIGGAGGYFQLNPVQSGAAVLGAGSVGGTLTAQMMATGGIAISPTLAVVGEAGPEAVIPLSMLGGGGAQTVVIDMSGAQFWGPEDVDAFISRFGGRLAQFLLPGAGMAVRRG